MCNQHAIQLNIAQRGLEIHQAIQRLSNDVEEGMDVDKLAHAEEMLKQLKAEYMKISRETDDDSLFDPESVCSLPCHIWTQSDLQLQIAGGS